jgi:hypothetical protein
VPVVQLAFLLNDEHELPTSFLRVHPLLLAIGIPVVSILGA